MGTVHRQILLRCSKCVVIDLLDPVEKRWIPLLLLETQTCPAMCP